MDSFNISISRDGIDDLEALGEVGLKKEESVLEEIFANPTEIYPQLSLDLKHQAAQEHNQLMKDIISLIQKIKIETLTKDEEEKSKLEKNADKLALMVQQMQDKFFSVTREFDKIVSVRLDRNASKVYGYLNSDKKEPEKDTSLFLQTKNKIDEDLKSKLNDISMIIKDLELKSEALEEGQKPDHSEVKKIKNETERKLKEFQDQSQILELSSYIDALNNRNLTREDQGKLAYLEDKLNESKVIGATELYISDIYPKDESDVSAHYSKILEADIKNFGDDLPPVRIQSDNENFLSALDDIRSFRDDNYQMSISDMMDINSLLQTNFYKSLDNYTVFQTNCLKKKLNIEITPEEKKKNEEILKSVENSKLNDTIKKKFHYQEKGLIFIISILQAVFKKETGVDVLITEDSQMSDMDKIAFITNGDNKLYSLNLYEQDYDKIIDDPITFEKFVSELKFYTASGLSLDPNLIRIVRIKKLDDGGVQADIDIRKSDLTIELLNQCSDFIVKNFGKVKYLASGCLKKFNISLDDFAFQHNMQYGYHPDPLNRGGYPYFFPPENWRRIGLKVLDKYRAFPPHNDNWIGEGEKGWPVAFHGLRYEGVEAPVSGIISGGFSRGWANYHDDKFFQMDVSINSQRIEHDCIENENQVRVYVAEKIRDRIDDTYEEIGCATTSEKPWIVDKIGHFNYLRPHKVEYMGKNIYLQIAFQCRINPSAIRIPNLQRDYIIINGPDNVRAYGIMFKEVSKQFYEEWNQKYDYMGRFYENEDNVYNRTYKILEKGLKNPSMIEDLSILGHKKEWIDPKLFKRFSHIYTRGKKFYDRPSHGWIRLGLNVEKLYPHIDWRSRLTRGLKVETEWAVAYTIFDVADPNCYKNLKKSTTLYDSFNEASSRAQTFEVDDESFKILIQVRYEIRGAKADKAKGLSVAKDNILPYGILIKSLGENIAKKVSANKKKVKDTKPPKIKSNDLSLENIKEVDKDEEQSNLSSKNSIIVKKDSNSKDDKPKKSVTIIDPPEVIALEPSPQNEEIERPQLSFIQELKEIQGKEENIIKEFDISKEALTTPPENVKKIPEKQPAQEIIVMEMRRVIEEEKSIEEEPNIQDTPVENKAEDTPQDQIKLEEKAPESPKEEIKPDTKITIEVEIVDEKKEGNLESNPETEEKSS